MAQARDLGEDVPHPMRLLVPGLKLRQRPRIDGRLGLDVALQAQTPAFLAGTSPMAAQSLSCQPQDTAWSKFAFSRSAVGIVTLKPSAAARARLTSFNPKLSANPAGSYCRLR